MLVVVHRGLGIRRRRILGHDLVHPGADEQVTLLRLDLQQQIGTLGDPVRLGVLDAPMHRHELAIYGVAVGVGGLHRIVARRAQAVLAQALRPEQGVRVGADHHVHIRQPLGQGQFVAMPEVGGQHDVAHALGAERVDGGLWSADGRTYRSVKRIERTLLLGADHVITLTHAAKREIETWPYMAGQAHAPITGALRVASARK